jgi:hypothetical protein
MLNNDRYIVDNIEIATDVPLVWFQKDERSSAKKLLKRVPGAVSIHGVLRKDHHDDPSSQMLVVWLVETRNDGDAAALVQKTAGKIPGDGRSSVGVSVGSLFCLMVGGSFVVGTESFETVETLTKLGEELRPVLDRADKSNI